jgi:hypothetical protein
VEILCKTGISVPPLKIGISRTIY